jgi:hypothetical protein
MFSHLHLNSEKNILKNAGNEQRKKTEGDWESGATLEQQMDWLWLPYRPLGISTPLPSL